jgi:protease-4
VPEPGPDDARWQRDLIARLASAGLAEQRRARRWGIFWMLLSFSYLTVLLLLAVAWKDSGESAKSGRHTALVEIKGLIAPGTDSSAE